jgi:aspartate aminotransferase-like enzyme
MPGVFALHASIGLLLEAGLETVGRRIGAVLDVLAEGLPKLGFAPVLHRQAIRSGILAARPPAGVDARRAMNHLEAGGVACSARAGFLRLSPHFGNEPEDAERVLELLARF